MKFAKKITFLSIVTALMASQASPAQAFGQDYIPTDPGIVYQKYFGLINLTPSWSNDIFVNKQVIVAVLDSGVDLDHPDLVENIWTNPGETPGDGIDNDNNSYIDDVHGWDFVSSDNIPEPDLDKDYDYTAVNHGTVVAGIIAASVNSQGIVGIAPQVKIMPLKILNAKGSGNTLVLSQAIDYAVENGADVINLSLVGDFYDQNLQKAITNAYHHGVMLVAASGNEKKEGISLDNNPRYPVCDITSVNEVLGVAAVDQERKLAVFSNYGKKCIDISAPGANIYSTVFYEPSMPEFTAYYQGGWNGTSVATPIVSATAALIKMNFPELRPFDIYNIIKSTAQSVRDVNPNNYVDLGSGLIDIGAALNLAKDYESGAIKIVLAAERGLAPEVMILNQKGNLESTFLAYGEKFRGGVNVAVGDVDGDGISEIVTAPASSGGPHIRVFDKSGKVISEFFAYDAKFTGGVNVALGDVNNDDKDEIVTAPASAHEPEIKVFDNNALLKGKFLAYASTLRQGVNIAVGDVNNDAWNEIVTVPAKSSAPQIKMFNIKGKLKSEFLAYNQYLKSGIKIVAKDISGDGLPEIITLPSKSSAALLKVYDSQGLEKDSFYVRSSQDKNGYYFDILAR